MKSKNLPFFIATAVALLVFFDASEAFANREGGRQRGGGGGSMTRPGSGGNRAVSRPAAGNTRPAAGAAARPVQRPSNNPARPATGAKPGGGRVPSAPASRPAAPSTRPATGTNRPSGGGAASQLPSGNRPTQKPSRPAAGNADRPAQQPDRAQGGDRPGTKPAQRPSKGDVGNFLGVNDRPSTLPSTRPDRGQQRPGTGQRPGVDQRPGSAQRPGIAQRPAAGQLPARENLRPEQRPDWNERAQDRGDQWQQRVDNRHESWNKWSENKQDRLNNFQNTREDRWNKLEGGREDRQDWRDQNRDDWQDHRKDLWEYRGDRAEEIWDNARDWHDDVFDDHWWGNCGWGHHYPGIGHYPANPWWWWRPVGWAAVASFIHVVTPTPVYVDHGMTVIYEGDTVYVDGKPKPVAEYTQPIVNLAVNVAQPPPPMPPAEGQPAEWMPLGVFALAQEEKGEPVMFFQISVNREGVITGAFQSTLTDDHRSIAGQVDKTTQTAAWRIGDNPEVIYTTSLPNLTLDVSTVAIQFNQEKTQTWLLVRMPEPALPGQEAKMPEAPKSPPPLAGVKAD